MKSIVAILIGSVLTFATSSSAAEMRKWRTMDGKEIEGEFVTWAAGKGVVVRQPDGTEITIRPHDLVPRDRMYVRKMHQSPGSKPKPKEGDNRKPGEATWRTMGEYPSLVGEWVEDEAKKLYFAITQQGNRFVAKSTRIKLDDNVEYEWRMEGTITKGGRVSGSMVSSSGGREEKPGAVTGQLDPDGKALGFHVKWEGGEGDFAWNLKDMTGEYPSLAGEWVEDAAKKIYVMITQEGNKFVAKSNRFKLDDNEEHEYQVEGTITKDGRITGKFASFPEDHCTMTAQLDSDGNTIRAHSKADWGETDFTWTLRGSGEAGGQIFGLSQGGAQREGRAESRPSWSTSIVLTADGNELWTVNEDNDSVTALRVLDHAPFLEKVAEISVGRNPRTVAVSPDGRTLYVANRHSASLAIIDREKKQLVRFVGLGWASQPYGVVASPDGRYVYVSAYASGRLLKVDVGNIAECRVVKSISVTGHPWALAITGDGQRVFVTEGVNAGRYFSRDPAAVTRINTDTFDTKTIALAKDWTRDTGGYVSMLRGIVITPDGKRAIIACQHNDSDRGKARDQRASLSFKTEVQPVLCVIDLASESELRRARLVLSQVGTVINNPSALDLLAVGEETFALAVGQGSDCIKIVGGNDGEPTERGLVRVGVTLQKWCSGAAPDGICIDPARSRAYVLNYLNRTASVLRLSDDLIDTKEVAEVRLTGTEPLSDIILRGKKVFYSSELGTSKDSWISCANCHPDGGGTDGRVWDFSQFGGSREAQARTLSLRGTTAYRSRLFWQGRSDEVQDLENGVRLLFGGQLIPGEANPTLGKPNAGLGKDFDAIAAYIASLRRVQPSPFRTEEGRLTNAAQKGRELFFTGCEFCHRPEMRFGNSSRLNPEAFEPHDVGTGGKYNVPSLVGTWENGAWLHDGRAVDIRGALRQVKDDKHAKIADLSMPEIRQLCEFVNSIDEGGNVRTDDGAGKKNLPPVIEVPLLGTRMRVEPGDPVAFLGSRCYDPDGNIISWVWSFRDDSPQQEVEARSTFGDIVHVFPNRRSTFRVSLKVTDDQGAFSERTWYIGVGCKPAPEGPYKP